MTAHRIYLDYNATTPCHPEVVDEMLPFFNTCFGNAASRSHPFGWEAAEAVENARERIARLTATEPQEIIFTSGATESDNLALKGVFETYARKGKHIITLKTEHKAVLDTCKRLEKQGAEITYLSVNREGLVDLEELEAAIRSDTILVAVMWANNETGVIQPVKAIGEICGRHGVLFFSDATQAVGKIRTHPREQGIHLMAFSAHKMYGPKGVGALYLSRKSPRARITALIDGGGHERGLRSGTLNVPGIAGFGKAAEMADLEMEQDATRLQALRDKLESALIRIEDVYVNGAVGSRMPHVSNLAFRHVDDEALISACNREIAVSSGSACSSASLEPSHVLAAMGLEDDLLQSSLRFSLGKFTTEEDIDFTIAAIKKGVEQLRALSPVWEMYKSGVDFNKIR